MRLKESEGFHGVAALAAPVSEEVNAGSHRAFGRWLGELADDAATIVGVDCVSREIVPLADKIDIGLIADAAPFSRDIFGHGDLRPGRQAVVHDKRAICADQPEALHEIPPRRLELMPGIDKRNVEAATLLVDRPQAFANVESGTAIVDGQAIVIIVWASIHQPAAGQEFCAVDLVVAPSARVGAQLEIVTIAVHLGQVIE